MNTRPIPSTGEQLPVIGIGTYKGFDARPGSAQYGQLPGVLDALFAAGGSVIDSSPMYGQAFGVPRLRGPQPVRSSAFTRSPARSEFRVYAVPSPFGVPRLRGSPTA